MEKGGTMTFSRLRSRVTASVFGASLVVLLFSLALLAQQANFGRILGKVSDPSGAVLPGATISIIDTQRGLARTVTTDEAGQYNAPTLIPGTYTVRVEFPGFKTLDRQNVVVEVGKEILVDFCLCTCFSKPQRIVLSYRKDRLRRVSSRKALACGRFPDRAESGMRPWAVCDDCGERQIRPDKPGAALGSHRDGFR